MKRTRTILVFLLLASGAVVLARPQERQYAWCQTGNDLYARLQDCEKVDAVHEGRANATLEQSVEYLKSCWYATGYMDGIIRVLNAIGIVELSGNVTQGQVKDIMVLYLKNHPDKRDQSSTLLAIEALREAFPPKKGDPQ